MKCITDRGKRCQALSKRWLTIDKTDLSLEFEIHGLQLAAPAEKKFPRMPGARGGRPGKKEREEKKIYHRRSLAGCFFSNSLITAVWGPRYY